MHYIDYISSCIRAGGISSKDDLLGSTENTFACLRGLEDFYQGRGSSRVNDLKEIACRNYERNSGITVAKLHTLVRRATEN
jgi:hypothetical protein